MVEKIDTPHFHEKLVMETMFRTTVIETVEALDSESDAKSVAETAEEFLHALACFTTRNSTKVVLPWTGARLGDVLADAVFAISARVAHDDLHERFRKAELVEKGRWGDSRSF